MLSFFLFIISLAFTLVVKFVNVAPIGPEGSSVGLAVLNAPLHSAVGVHPLFDTLSDYLLIPAFLSMFIFLLLGLKDLSAKKSLKLVDRRFFLLCGFYLLVGLVYFLFEQLALNYRPILDGDILEASFPSSHTFFALTLFSAVFLNADLISNRRPARRYLRILSPVLASLVVVFRVLSGVHWLTDILGGLLWGATLASLLALALEKLPLENSAPKTAP